MRPGAGGNAQAASGDVEPSAGQDGSPGGIERSAPFIGEINAVRIVGVPFNSELAEVMEPMMSVAKGHEVVGVRSAPVLPVPDVMDMQPPAPVTARDPASPVTLLDHD